MSYAYISTCKLRWILQVERISSVYEELDLMILTDHYPLVLMELLDFIKISRGFFFFFYCSDLNLSVCLGLGYFLVFFFSFQNGGGMIGIEDLRQGFGLGAT